MKKLICLSLSLIMIITSFTAFNIFAVNGTAEPQTEGTNFITGDYDFDEILKRPYNDDVPLGFSDNIFALYSSGWGFSRIFRTGLSREYNMNVNLNIDGELNMPNTATYRPSQVSMEQVGDVIESVISVNTAGTGYPMPKASYTSQWGYINSLNNGVTTENNRWTNYVSPVRAVEEWVEIDFGDDNIKSIDGVNLHVYTDGGNSMPPSSISIAYWNGSEYAPVTNVEKTPANIIAGKNEYRFDNIETSKIRAYIMPAAGKCITLTEFEVINIVPIKSKIEGYKYITKDDMAVSVINVTNVGAADITANVAVNSGNITAVSGKNITGTIDNFNLRLAGDGFTAADGKVTKEVVIPSGETETFKVAMAFSPSSTDKNAANINNFFNDSDYLNTQKIEFNDWYKENIPYFESPDPVLNQIYYFRWLTYRNNIRKTAVGSYIITEFMPNVGWASTYNAIPCPLGHHFYEGRWIRDTKYLDSYADYWFNVGNPRLYSSWLADACYAQFLVDGDKDKIISYLPDLMKVVDGWDTNGNTPFHSNYGLYRSIADRDGMENAIGSDGLRPTLNSYIYGDSIAISKIADMADNKTVKDNYLNKANLLKESLDSLWNNNFYRVRRTSTGYPIQDVVEEIGLVPWYFNLPSEDKSVAWEKLMDPQYLYAEYGPTTAQRSHPSYRPGNEYGTGTCRWDGPSWPFATTQTLVGMANLLNNYSQNYVDKDDYYTVLWNYANSHYKTNSLDGKKYPWLAEDLNPENGRWIADEARSVNYNHSAFNDMIITGLIGIRPSDDNVLVINPLLPDNKWDYFCMENVPYHGRNITVLYDKNGTKYNNGTGFSVYVDGILAAHEDTYKEVTIQLQTKNAVPNLALNNATVYPRVIYSYQNENDRAIYVNKGTASSGKNWSNIGSENAEDWIGIDLGTAAAINKVNIDFIDDADNNLPQNIKLQYFNGTSWSDISCNTASINAGSNSYSFDSITASMIRAVMTGGAIGIKQFEVIQSKMMTYPGVNIIQGAPVIASYTSTWDTLGHINDGIISYNDSPRSRWSNWNEVARTVEERIEFTVPDEASKDIGDVKVYFFTDSNCALSKYRVELFDENNISKFSSSYVMPTVRDNNVVTVDQRIDGLKKAVVYLTPEPGKNIAVTEIQVNAKSEEVIKDYVISENSDAVEFPKACASFAGDDTNFKAYLLNDGIITKADNWNNMASPYRDSDSVGVDFGSEQVIDSINVYFNTGGNFSIPTDFTVQYWDSDAEDFVNAGNVKVLNDNNDYRFDFDTINTSKVKITMLADDNSAISISQIEVFRKSAKLKYSVSTFDKADEDMPNEIYNEITWNEASRLEGIYVDGIELPEGSYKVFGDTITLYSSYLSEQPLGSLVLSVKFNNMNPQIWEINITDPTVTSVKFMYEENEVADLAEAAGEDLEVSLVISPAMIAEKGNPNVYIALYDQNKLVNIEAHKNAVNGSYAISIPDETDGLTLKVFIWDSNHAPAFEVTTLN